MFRTTFACLLALALAACATTGRLADAQRNYCSEADPAARAVALAVIRAKVPDYPASGLCTDAEQALAQKIAEQAEQMPEGATIDLEQARRDQARFSGAE